MKYIFLHGVAIIIFFVTLVEWFDNHFSNAILLAIIFVLFEFSLFYYRMTHNTAEAMAEMILMYEEKIKNEREDNKNKIEILETKNQFSDRSILKLSSDIIKKDKGLIFYIDNNKKLVNVLTQWEQTNFKFMSVDPHLIKLLETTKQLLKEQPK